MKFALFYEIPVAQPWRADRISHEHVMQAIELIGKHVLPSFA
jgi:hypothetical protein